MYFFPQFQNINIYLVEHFCTSVPNTASLSVSSSLDKKLVEFSQIHETIDKRLI